jgi:SHS2 domain-containing protein
VKAHWEHFDHEADMGVRGYGETLAGAFEQAAMALTAVAVDLALVEPLEKVDIACEEPDAELLLVDWLNALIYEMWTRRVLFARFAVSIERGRLRASVWGQRVDVEKHQPAVEIKGATYTELKVEQRADGWMAQCVVDV